MRKIFCSINVVLDLEFGVSPAQPDLVILVIDSDGRGVVIDGYLVFSELGVRIPPIEPIPWFFLIQADCHVEVADSFFRLLKFISLAAAIIPVHGVFRIQFQSSGKIMEGLLKSLEHLF